MFCIQKKEWKLKIEIWLSGGETKTCLKDQIKAAVLQRCSMVINWFNWNISGSHTKYRGKHINYKTHWGYGFLHDVSNKKCLIDC